MHDVLVVDPLSHFRQQPVVPDIVKVGAQIKIKNPRLPLDDGSSHSLDRVMCLPFGPISKRSRLEIRLEHRLEDELERTLHHSVTDRRDRQNADFAPVFRYLLFSRWEWLVGAPDQFVAQLLEQSLHALRLDRLEGHSVYSRGAIVLFGHIDGRLCHLVLAFLTVETSQMAGPLGSTDITPLPRYCGPSRHPLVFGRLPGVAGYTAYLAPAISRRDEEGFSSYSACPCHRAVASTPPR